jgi:hypothetical protein
MALVPGWGCVWEKECSKVLFPVQCGPSKGRKAVQESSRTKALWAAIFRRFIGEMEQSTIENWKWIAVYSRFSIFKRCVWFIKGRPAGWLFSFWVFLYRPSCLEFDSALSCLECGWWVTFLIFNPKAGFYSSYFLPGAWWLRRRRGKNRILHRP